MRICHLSTAHSRYDTRIFIKEAQTLSRAGIPVLFLVADGHGNELRDAISIVDVGLSEGRLNRMIGATFRVLKKAISIKNIDVYHFHDPELIWVGAILAKMGKTVIFDIHEDIPKQMISKPYLTPWLRRIVATLYNFFEKRLIKTFYGVIAATPSIGDKYNGHHPLVTVVNNYPLMKEFVFKTTNKTEMAVCYMGGISKIRGICEIVQAVGITKNKVDLLLGGRFSDSESEVREIEGWSMVKELGFLGRKDVQDVYSRSIAGLVTLHPTINYLDSLPVKMFEYMAASIPVIASNFPLWKEIVEGNQCGICVDPLDPRAIASAIDYLIEHPNEAAAMGANGRRAVVEKFNWDSEAVKLLQLYEKIGH